jgi:hypothetical protein
VRLARLPIHPGDVYGIVKELRAAAEDFRPLILAGAQGPGRELRDALTAGGDGQTVRDLSCSVL